MAVGGERMSRDVRLEPLQAWALAQPKKPHAGHNHRIRGGGFRCFIYWTRKQAKVALEAYPECQIVRVVINQVFP